MKKVLLLLAISLTTHAFAQPPVAGTAAHAKELLIAMGSDKTSRQVFDMMIASFKQKLPDVPTEFWDEAMKEVSIDELLDLMVPIYAKYYTDEELAQLTAFYRSPLGQKLVQRLPAINQESFTAGQEWGKLMGEKVVARLKEKGYLKD